MRMKNPKPKDFIYCDVRQIFQLLIFQRFDVRACLAYLLSQKYSSCICD